MNKIRKIILVAIWILALSCLYVFLFDPLTPYLNRQKLDALQVELNAAQEKWDLKNIRNYTYEVHYGSPMWGGCEAKITVKQEKLVGVTETMHGGFKKLLIPVVLTNDQWRHDNCDYSNATISEAFEKMQKIIKGNITLNIFFDQKYGFITKYYGNPNVSNGLLIGLISDSGFSYTLSDFQNLDVSVP